MRIDLTRDEMRSIQGTLSTYSMMTSDEIPSSLHDSILDLNI